MTATLLSLPADPRVTELLAAWPEYQARLTAPRSKWLHDLEAILREHYPAANSDSLTLTARMAAPFPLALPGVP